MEALADRLTHDPRLSVAVHEVLSKVAAIRSTATILVETKDIEDSWQERFQRNLFEDSGQLTDSAQALVSFLEGEAGPNMGVEPPRGKVQKYLEEAGFHFPSLEDPDGSEAAISALLDGFEGQDDPFAKRLMESFFIQYRRDASGMPRSDLMRHIAEFGFDPSLIAQNFDQTVAAACRRLACLPTGDVPAFGYVACDASGLLTWRKPISGFSLPRSGVGCPRWPLFRALGLAGQAVYAFLHQAATSSQKFHAFAAAETVWPEGIFDAPVVQAGMLLIPAECMDSKSSQGEISVGSTCRLCPIDACAARQEPSVLVEGL
ncbi:MAG: short-chain fatty acyl-CoA regulator family protein [Mangrovicoccus sp.]